MKIEWKIDLGSIITFVLMLIGFAAQWGSLNTRLNSVEAQQTRQMVSNEALLVMLSSLKDTIIRVQTQMDEREKRFEATQAARNLRSEDQRALQSAAR